MTNESYVKRRYPNAYCGQVIAFGKSRLYVVYDGPNGGRTLGQSFGRPSWAWGEARRMIVLKAKEERERLGRVGNGVEADIAAGTNRSPLPGQTSFLED